MVTSEWNGALSRLGSIKPADAPNPAPITATSAPAPASSGPVQYSGAQPGLWYDPSKYNGASDLSAINTLSGLKFYGATPETTRYTEQGDIINPAEGAYVISSNGTKLYLGGDANSGYSFSDQYNDPTGQSDRDQVRVSYSYDPSTGTAKPTANTPFYQPGDWVSTYRPVLQAALPVITAGIGGALGMAGEVGGGAETVSGMDLAADAAVGTGNNVYTAGSMFGPGSTVAGGAAGSAGELGGGSGYTEAAGNAGYTTSAAEDAAAAGTPVTGSEAAAQGAALDASSSSGFLDALKQGGSKLVDYVTKNPQQAAGLAGMLGSLGGSGSGSSGSTSGTGALSHAVAAQDMGKAAQYDYSGFTPTPFTPRAGHSQLSSAVNLNDPSAAMFGQGAVPRYYKVPGMAEGGSVDDANLWGGDDRAYPVSGAQLPTAYNDVPVTTSGYHDPAYNAPDRAWYAPATDWLNRLGSGDKKTQQQMVMGMGALGLIASLLNKNRAPGFRSVSDLQAGLGHNAPMSAANQARMDAYFNTPAARYTAPPAPQVLVARAEGGRIEPKVGTKGPVRAGGTGGGLSAEALRLLAQADGAPTQPSGIGALPANPVTNPAAITAARMQSAGLAHGGQPGAGLDSSPVAEFNPMAHGARVPGDAPGQQDNVPAALSSGEYVMDADTVSSLGDGNNAAGSAALDRFREQVRAHKRSGPVSDIPPKAKSPLAYFASAAKQKGAK